MDTEKYRRHHFANFVAENAHSNPPAYADDWFQTKVATLNSIQKRYARCILCVTILKKTDVLDLYEPSIIDHVY